VLLKHGLLNLITQEISFPASFLDKIIVNMSSCFEVEEETDEEDDKQENSPRATNKTLAAL